MEGSEFIGESGEEAEALAELGGTDADAAAVADLVFFVEEVDDIDAEFDVALAPGAGVEGVFVADVDGVIGLHFL